LRGEPAHIAIDVTEVERIAALGWRGLDEARLGDWLLRAAGGFTGRANSALVLGPPPRTETGWVHDLVGWYAQRRLPAKVQIPLPGGEAVDSALAAAGWRAHDTVRFLTGDIQEVQELAAATPGGFLENRHVALPQNGPRSHARLDAAPDDAWLGAYRYRGAVLPAQARDVLVRAGPDTELCFASLRSVAHGDSGDSGEVLAVARGATAKGWLGVTAVTVADRHRRQGHGTRLMAELADWGAGKGARSVYLQVAADNSSALRLYAQLGFVHHHDYRYRVGPSPPKA